MVRKVRRSVTQYLLKLDQENLIRWERKQGTPYLQLYAAKTGNGTLESLANLSNVRCNRMSKPQVCMFPPHWMQVSCMRPGVDNAGWNIDIHISQKAETLRKSYTSGVWSDEVWSSNYTTGTRWQQALWNISTLQHMHAELLNKIKEHVVTGQSCVFQETGLCLVRKYL